MTKPNGNKMKWIIGLILGILGLAVTALTSMNAMGVFQGEIKRDVVHNHEAIVGVKEDIKGSIIPELLRAKKHVDQSEIETPRIVEDIDELGRELGDFKREIKKDFKDFSTEQKAMNNKILDKLNER